MKTKSILLAIALPLLWTFTITFLFVLPFLPSEEYKWLIGGTFGSLLAWLLSYVFIKWDGFSFSQIGLIWQSDTLRKFFMGFLMGSAIAIVMLGLVILMADLTIERNTSADIPMAMFWLLAFLPLAFMEELAFRGYAFIKLNKMIGLRLTIIITSILFAYYHDASGSSFVNQLMGPGIWGIIYGLAAIWSDGIALPTGLHAAANVVLALLGMKEDQYAVWLVDYKTEATDAMQAHTDTVGIAVQLLLLAFGIFLTEWYLRKRKKSNTNVYYQ